MLLHCPVIYKSAPFVSSRLVEDQCAGGQHGFECFYERRWHVLHYRSSNIVRCHQLAHGYPALSYDCFPTSQYNSSFDHSTVVGRNNCATNSFIGSKKSQRHSPAVTEERRYCVRLNMDEEMDSSATPRNRSLTQMGSGDGGVLRVSPYRSDVHFF